MLALFHTHTSFTPKNVQSSGSSFIFLILFHIGCLFSPAVAFAEEMRDERCDALLMIAW